MDLIENIKESTNFNIADRKDFLFTIPTDVWNSINVQEYSYKKCIQCEFKNECYYYQLRQKLPTFDGIVICNQDLLTIHLKKKNSWQRNILNNDISIIVVDEAHNLEEKVRNIYTTGYKKKDVMFLLNNSTKLLRGSIIDLSNDIHKAEKLLGKLYSEFENQIKEQIQEKPNEMKDAERFFIRDKRKVLNIADELSYYINRVFQTIDIHSDSKLDSMQDIYDNLDDLNKFFVSMANYMDESIYWLEKNKPSIHLVSCPKDIDDKTKMLYFQNGALTILTSATLTSKGKGSEEERYSYFIKNIGLPTESRFLSEPKESPFPYDEHAMIYYSDDLPHPTDERKLFIEKGTERILQLLEVSQGKALILFTSKSDMEEVYNKLQSRKLSFQILIQQEGSSQEEVLEVFKKDINSVLLGTGAFWEGINIEGVSLSNLIIFRLPFPVPDPIINYKRSIVEYPLIDVDVPEMIIKLKQGIGRLIRSENDKGIVSIIDSRLSETSHSQYKEMVWESLPIKSKTNSIYQIKKFYQTVCGRYE